MQGSTGLLHSSMAPAAAFSSTRTIACQQLPVYGPKPLPRRTWKVCSPSCAGKPERDLYKEATLRGRRTLFDWEQWKHHRSTNRYSRNAKSIFSSEVLKVLGVPLLLTLNASVLTCFYMTKYQAGELPGWCPDITLDVGAALAPASFALSLLLVFRTNASYGRFQEARNFWGGVTQRTRDLVRQAKVWFDPGTEQTQLEMFSRWAVAFPKCMMVHLREDMSLKKELRDTLTLSELEVLEKSPHRPNTCLMMMTEIIKKTNLTPVQRFRMDENLMHYADMLGASERILRTPIPVSYTRHTTRFLAIWLTFLPLSIYKVYGWGTVPISLIIAFVLLAIEEIGVQIEEPFVVLPLEAFCREIQDDVRDMLELGPVDVALKTPRPEHGVVNGTTPEDNGIPVSAAAYAGNGRY